MGLAAADRLCYDKHEVIPKTAAWSAFLIGTHELEPNYFGLLTLCWTSRGCPHHG